MPADEVSRLAARTLPGMSRRGNPAGKAWTRREMLARTAALRFAFRPPLRFTLRALAQGELRSSTHRERAGRSRPKISRSHPEIGNLTGKVTGNPEVHDRLGRVANARLGRQ